MRGKLLIVSMLLCAAVTVVAQSDILADGELVAYGVRADGAMPPALEACLGRREVSRLDGTRSHAFAKPLSRSIRARQVTPPPAVIGPLLTSIRDQEEPYNWLCPRWTYDDGHQSDEHCLSGCVATCIEQVMAYYRYPEVLTDTLHGWATDHYAIADMLPGTRFDWDNYLDDYRRGYSQQQGEAIALASLAAGMAVHMSYGLTSSGANLWRAETPLRKALGYGMVRLYDRVFYSPGRWHAILRHELECGRPVAYAGHTMCIGGHAFNIDGVDTSGFYHVNWGYNGSYDGWYDLDWLNPWEPTDTLADGIAAGFFSNHTLLAMHPSAEARPLEPDTFRLDSLGVVLHEIRLPRTPDTQGYIPGDFDFENTSRDTITYTYEVMSFLPTDTAVFYQADYVALSTLTLLPGERRTQRVYMLFDADGDRLLGISDDDETIPYTRPIHVKKGTPSTLEWGEGALDIAATSVALDISVGNMSASGIAGDLVTFCLFAGDDTHEDTRHYRVLSLSPGETTSLHVVFNGLQPSTRYRILVRCPWTVCDEQSFTTPAADGIRWVEPDLYSSGSTRGAGAYDLSGRPATPHSNVIVRDGRKVIKVCSIN